MSQTDLSHQAPEARFQLLTLYGRKPVLEALQDNRLGHERLHLAHSNRDSGVVADIIAAAEQRNIDIRRHERSALARISRNGKQDQGVALDVRCPAFGVLETLTAQPLPANTRLLALDGITNPQNAGMIVRSATAAGIDGILWPRRGVAALGPLVIKASAGTLFKAPIIHCGSLAEALGELRDLGVTIATLAMEAQNTVFEHHQDSPTVYVLGGETDGVSEAVRDLSDITLRVPMHNGVESLNVAVTAALVAYATLR